MEHQADISADDSSASASASSMAMVLYNPNLYQNRALLPLPVGWTSSSKSLTSFTLYPKLPAELRLMILDEGPRCVDVTYKKKSIYGLLATWPAISSTIPPPIALRLCQETRQEALKKYKNMFKCTWSGHHIYINPSRDSLYWTPECLAFPDSSPFMKIPEAIWEIMPADRRSKIERLVVPCSGDMGKNDPVRYELDGRWWEEDVFCDSWSTRLSRTRKEWHRAPEFNLFWIFDFFGGLKELTIHWYHRSRHISAQGMPLDNNEEAMDFVYEEEAADFESEIYDIADWMIQYYEVENPDWNPPKFEIIWME